LTYPARRGYPVRAMGTTTVAVLEHTPTPSRRSVLRAELAGLDAVALAERLEELTNEVTYLQAGLVYGTRRLAQLAAAAARHPEERLDIEGVMALTGRSRSWVEHHGHAIPGYCHRKGPGGRNLWLKREVLRGLAEGIC